MKKKYLLPLTLLCICVVLFGCRLNTGSGNGDQAALPLDGYYVYMEESVGNILYMHLQDQSGTLYVMNLPVPVTLQDGKISTNDGNGGKYTYENNKLSFPWNGSEVTLEYQGEALADGYKPIMPPAGTYAVSSVGVDGNIQFYSAVTDEILSLSQDGTGTFVFAGQKYALLLRDGILAVDGEPTGYLCYPNGEMLMLLWTKEEADSIVLRPVEEP